MAIKDQPWHFLAVELAVKLQYLLEPGEDSPPYEYYPEAVEIVDSLKRSKNVNQILVEDQIATTLSKNLEFDYHGEQFGKIADFLLTRMAYIQRYQV